MIHVLPSQLIGNSSDLAYDASNFTAVSGLLRLSTKYQVTGLRATILHGLSLFWPSTLPQWELRDCAATDSSGSQVPRLVLPHPMCVDIVYLS
jgi:hypothetical protein